MMLRSVEGLAGIWWVTWFWWEWWGVPRVRCWTEPPPANHRYLVSDTDLVLVRMVRCATCEMLARASPRKPKVTSEWHWPGSGENGEVCHVWDAGQGLPPETIGGDVGQILKVSATRRKAFLKRFPDIRVGTVHEGNRNIMRSFGDDLLNQKRHFEATKSTFLTFNVKS